MKGSYHVGTCHGAQTTWQQWNSPARFDGYGIRTPEMDRAFQEPPREPAPLPWIYRDPQRWLLPMLVIVGLVAVGLAIHLASSPKIEVQAAPPTQVAQPAKHQHGPRPQIQGGLKPCMPCVGPSIGWDGSFKVLRIGPGFGF